MSTSHSTSLLIFSLLLHLFSAKSHNAPAPDPSPALSGDVLGEPTFDISVDTLFTLPDDSEIFGSKYVGHVVSALFVFGDSLLDSGNNNFLPTMAKANYLPYGINFNGKPTGRFTNGKTTADFIAQIARLPLPPPYLGLSESQKKNISTGVNYASGACGILPDTGKVAGTCLTFDKQIDLFNSTLENLKWKFDSPERFAHYLSRSLLFINLGSNDFTINYARPGSDLSKQFTPQAFGQYLSNELAKRLQRLYELGTRKFLVDNVGALGCTPGIINSLKPVTPCVEPLNMLVSLYNMHLPAVLTQLQSTLSGSKFVHGDIYKFFVDVKATPAAFGMTDTTHSCCIDAAGNGTQPCFPNKTPCTDVNQHVFFDPFHPTQATHFLLTRRCFNESSVCTPINLKQLMLA